MAKRKLPKPPKSSESSEAKNVTPSSSEPSQSLYALSIVATVLAAIAAAAYLATRRTTEPSAPSKTCRVHANGESSFIPTKVTQHFLTAKFRAYDLRGELVESLADLDEDCDLYAIPRNRTNIHFIWPYNDGRPIELDHPKSPIEGKKITLVPISDKPRVIKVLNIVSEIEMESVRAFAVSDSNPYKMRRSTTGTAIWKKGEKGASHAPTSNTRTSENAFDVSSPTGFKLSKRGMSVLRVPYINELVDGLQVVRYGPLQAYSTHSDYYDYNTPFDPPFDFDPRRNSGSNRFATLFFYLNDGFKGGETAFTNVPSSNVAAVDADERALMSQGSWESNLVKQCRSSLRSEPSKGDAVLFYNQLGDGSLDPLTVHAGCPVTSGESDAYKWGANLWIWNRCRMGMPCASPRSKRPYAA